MANVLVSYAWAERDLPSRLEWVSNQGGGLFAYVYGSRLLLRSVQILLSFFAFSLCGSQLDVIGAVLRS